MWSAGISQLLLNKFFSKSSVKWKNVYYFGKLYQLFLNPFFFEICPSNVKVKAWGRKGGGLGGGYWFSTDGLREIKTHFISLAPFLVRKKVLVGRPFSKVGFSRQNTSKKVVCISLLAKRIIYELNTRFLHEQSLKNNHSSKFHTWAIPKS